MTRPGRLPGGLAALGGLALAGLACTGAVEGDLSRSPTGEPMTPMNKPPGNTGGKMTTPVNPGMGGMGGPVVTPPLPGVDVAGPAPLRRLTTTEYNNTLRDLFGADVPVITKADGFSADVEAYQGGFLKGATVGSANDARLYLD